MSDSSGRPCGLWRPRAGCRASGTPRDRRRHVLTLTAAGRATVDEVSNAVTGELLAWLSPGERETLHRLLLKAFGEPPA